MPYAVPRVDHQALQPTTTIGVVVPVHNEERSLPECREVLSRHLAATLPFRWCITVVDNTSADGT